MPLYTNLDGTTPDQGLRELLKWQLERPRLARGAPFDPPVRDNDGRAIHAMQASLTWIGHATFAQRLGGKVIATDPIWSKRIQYVIPRLAPPGVPFERMPKIDVVTVSHAHYDHLDMPTLKRIGPEALFVVPRDVGEL